MNKICFRCKKNKKLDDFYKHVGMLDGHLNKCKECAKEEERRRNKDKKVELSAYDKLRYRTNKERIKWHRYRGIVNRCTGKHKNRTYKVEGMEYLTKEQYSKWWKKNLAEFEKCYKVWEQSGFKNKFAPSIDRIDSSKGYMPNNMQWLTFSLNCIKHTK